MKPRVYVNRTVLVTRESVRALLDNSPDGLTSRQVASALGVPRIRVEDMIFQTRARYGSEVFRVVAFVDGVKGVSRVFKSGPGPDFQPVDPPKTPAPVAANPFEQVFGSSRRTAN